MKIIHTSDWHLGKKLYGRSRYEESEKFLKWLISEINARDIDALIVTGDIFDTVSPPNFALKQYYSFLHDAAQSKCRNIVIIAGNHDSPSFLGASKEILAMIDIYVVAEASKESSLDSSVIHLSEKDGSVGAIVCAVPFLREKDILIDDVEGAESMDDKSARMLEGIREYYARAVSSSVTECIRAGKCAGNSDSPHIPLIVTGHLFVAGGVTRQGDGVRETYVGNLERFGADIFTDSADYVALGHLHVPQIVASNPKIRYSGSPLPIGFGESEDKKTVIEVEFTKTPDSASESGVKITEIDVPCFRKLVSITGDLDEISDKIRELNFSGERCWAEVTYVGNSVAEDLFDTIRAMSSNSNVEVLKIRNDNLSTKGLNAAVCPDSLEDLSESTVFERCLKINHVPDDEWVELKQTFSQALTMVYEEDTNAE